MKKKGYKKRITISTDITPFEQVDKPLELIKEHFNNQEGYVDVWQHNAHFLGSIKNGDVTFSAKDKLQLNMLQELRAFNLTQEIRIWRTNNGLKGRLRKDNTGKGEQLDVLEVDRVLIKSEKLPKVLSNPSLRARYYIDYTDNGLATIGDYRFVDFVEFS